MDLSHPARSVVPSLAADVLVVLARTTMPMTGRQIHRLTVGASWSGVRRVLADLASTGIVDVTEAGPANLYVLNREHVATEAILALADLRGRLFARIRAALESWAFRPLAAAVFGSAARGDGDRASDIDILLVRPDEVVADYPTWASAVANLCIAIGDWSGNPGSVVDVNLSELEAMMTRGEPLVAEVRRDQIVLLGGELLADALTAGR